MNITDLTVNYNNATNALEPNNNNIDNETMLLPCLSRRKGELFDDGGEWLLFVPVIVTAALMLTVFVSSVVYTMRRRVLRVIEANDRRRV